ncbi:ATP-binding protein [Paractinoplanes toevensis]|uniref:Histidine kinase/HSP90-like ATPase domain-containing protein n=1 Tax=Paractinoplanes toevensis TaxID=571911 RepID=A0A919W9G8_9ACTN|nr:ATP-binding protein [Actinoplanes toevensis]GIM96096.1 hypothetical protein Ato02nite_078890 [Actinoplanes toevensis]
MTAPADPPAAATRPAEKAYDEPGDLAPVREFVRTESAALGLPRLRGDLLTVAVSELATNTLQHTGGGGRVLIWAEPGRVLCEILDHGTPPSFGRAMPAADQPRGRGLAIVERICDEVSVSTGPEGTAICLTMLL